MPHPMGGLGYTWPFFLGAVLAYLLGSVPFGLVLTKLAGYGDIRAIGSGNIGATNVLRTGNKGLAALTLVLDGGKGVATAGGILLAYAWPAALAAIATWLIVAALTRYSSLAALIGASLAPVYTWFFTREFQQTEVALFLAILILLRHHANIRRLIRGEESKIRLGKT